MKSQAQWRALFAKAHKGELSPKVPHEMAHKTKVPFSALPKHASFVDAFIDEIEKQAGLGGALLGAAGGTALGIWGGRKGGGALHNAALNHMTDPKGGYKGSMRLPTREQTQFAGGTVGGVTGGLSGAAIGHALTRKPKHRKDEEEE